MLRIAMAAWIGVLPACGGAVSDVDPGTTGGAATSTGTSTEGSEGTSSESESAASSSGDAEGSSSASSESVSGSSGEPAEPSVVVEQITADNRAHVEMHGGWGAHLRAPMQAPDGTLWFAFDGGPDVNTNSTIRYARRGDVGWEVVAEVAHGSGVQQNSAHVLRDNAIMTYSVNPGASVLEECWLDTTDPSAGACNTMQIGGAYSTPPSSNYVGAAVGPDGETIVWFTVVGASGGTGQFIYTHDYGGGWNGPTVTALPGYNDYAYVRASFRDPSTIVLFGQAYVGDYPTGEYALGVDEVDFGQPAAFETLGPPARAGQVRTGGDVWIDPLSGDAHAIGRIGNELGYWFVPAGAAWADHLEPVAWIDGALDGRWLYEEGGPLVVVLTAADGVQARWAEPGAAIDWSAAQSLDIVFPVDGLDHPSAIYAAGPEYQTTPMTGLHFAVCGTYGVADDQIWYGALTL